MNSMHQKGFLAFSIALALAACGGGGGSGTTAANNPSSSGSTSTDSSSAADAAEAAADTALGISESDTGSLIDYGAGPGVAENTVASMAAAVPAGPASANVTGTFGAAVAWPIIPIHAILLPDGRVMNYGTNSKGQQGALLVYDVWDPTLGTGTNAHMTLPNTTSTDLFCNSQSLMPTGQVLLTGGDLTLNGRRNFSRPDTNIFTPATNTIATNTAMNYARWYPSLVALPNKQFVVFGGRENQTTISPAVPGLIPELYDPSTRSWTSLTGAKSVPAFGNVNTDWYYPRAFVAPGGNIMVLTNDGPMWMVGTSGVGTIKKIQTPIAPPGAADLPTVSFAPGKLLSLRSNSVNVVIDYTTLSAPVVTTTDPMDQVRFWASGTVMADGKVLINGGSSVKNVLTKVAYTSQIWNPATGHFTAGAIATKPRLYHSNALLLPDATVLTGGGGAPGPVKNLNAEIYYPPYLYASNGTPAVRPTLTATGPKTANVGGTISVNVGKTDLIGKLTFIRTGSATHSYDSDERFINLTFSQSGQNLMATLPSDPTVLVPGFYMLFAFNEAGVPSLALIFTVS